MASGCWCLTRTPHFQSMNGVLGGGQQDRWPGQDIDNMTTDHEVCSLSPAVAELRLARRNSIMALLSHLDAFCNWLRTRVRAHVSIGRPDKALTGIYVLPWYAVPNLQKRNMPRMPGLEETVGDFEAQTFDIHFLLWRRLPTLLKRSRAWKPHNRRSMIILS